MTEWLERNGFIPIPERSLTDDEIQVLKSIMGEPLGGGRVMEKLKPCQFCGGKANCYVAYDTYHVSCTNALGCPVIPQTWGYDTEAEAIEAWNRRTNDEADRR
jgi:hypothetical protein